MSFRFLPVWYLFLGLPYVAHAQQSTQDDREQGPIQQVQVKGPGADQLRRDDVLGRLVVGRDELQRYGDTTLSDALKRQPGISISSGEIRLRGLGAGYTQILIDGQPAPPGFAIDTLSPDIIERIEIQRSAQADMSTQGVAGSINILLRKVTGAARRNLKLSAEHGLETISPAATLQWTTNHPGAAYGITATASESHRQERPIIDELNSDPSGTALRRFFEWDDNRLRKLTMTPRTEFKFDNGDTLAWDGLIDLSHLDSRGSQAETTREGVPTASPNSRWRGLFDTWLVKSDINFSHRMDTGRLVAKTGLEANGRDGDYHFYGTSIDGLPTLNRAVTSGALQRRAYTNGKYIAPLAAGHDVSIGWDMSVTRRSETRVQYDNGPESYSDHVLTQDYSATVDRLAIFAQDEWTLNAALQAYVGLRWEGLKTHTSGPEFTGISSASRVLSPVAQLIWKIPGSKRDQLRVSVARTYKAPEPRELVPRRFTVNNDNGPANPDYQGNPFLRPELAWGIDTALESYFARDSVLSLSFYARHIRDVMLTELWQDNGAWVSMPTNGGNATPHGVEFDIHGPIPAFAPGSTAIELRINGARNWSRVDHLPRPDNRLSTQAPITLNIGGDVRMATGTSVGANLHLVGGWRATTSPGLTEVSGVIRELESYVAWKSAGLKWRLTLSNLLRPTRRYGMDYGNGTTSSTRRYANPDHVTVRLQCEFPI